MKKLLLLLPVVAVVATGCMTVEKRGDDYKVSVPSIGMKRTISELQIDRATNGTVSVRVKGYQADGVQIVETAVRTGIEAGTAAARKAIIP